MRNSTIKGCWPWGTFTLLNLTLLEKMLDTPGLIGAELGELVTFVFSIDASGKSNPVFLGYIFKKNFIMHLRLGSS